MRDANPSPPGFAHAHSARPTRVRYGVIALVALASSSAYLTRHCIAVANTAIQEDLGLNNLEMGAVLSAFAWGYLICQVPGGWLGNRFGTRAALAGISSLWSLFAVWTSLAGSYLALVSSRVAFGMAQGGLTPLSAQIIKDWIPLNARGMSSALIGAAMSLGAAFTLYFTAVLLKEFDWSWREVFRAYSLVGIVWAIVFYWFFRTKPTEHRGLNAGELELIEAGDVSPQASSPEAASEQSTDDREQSAPVSELVVDMLSSRSMWGLCVQAFFRAAGYFFFVTWFPKFLEDAYGLSLTQVRRYSPWPLLTVVVGTMCGGVIIDWLLRKTGSKWISRSGVSFVALLACALFTLLAAWATSAQQVVLLLAVGAFFSGLANPAAWAATIDVAGKQTAVPFGTMNMAGCLAGMSVPIFVGHLFDRIQLGAADWNVIIYLHAGFYLAGAIVWLIVNPNDSLSNGDTTAM